jgi:ABC-2 type transport system permease protein
MASYTSIAFAMFVGWRIGAFRQEEAEGRLDNLLVRGVVRWRLLTSTAVLAVGAGALLILISGVGLWAGATLVDAKVTVGQVAEPMAGTLTIVVLFVGIAVLTYGLVPRLTTAVPVTLAVLTFLLETFGQILKWPDVIVGASPFNHLARLPASPLTVTAAVVMTTLGLATAAIGIIAFARRDLKGT